MWRWIGLNRWGERPVVGKFLLMEIRNMYQETEKKTFEYAEIVKKCFRKENVGAFLAEHHEGLRFGDISRMIYTAFLPLGEKLNLYQRFIELMEISADRKRAEIVYELMRYTYDTFCKPKTRAAYLTSIYENNGRPDFDVDILCTNKIDDGVFGSLEDVLSKMDSDYQSGRYCPYNPPAIEITQILVPKSGVAYETVKVVYGVFNDEWKPFMIETETEWFSKTKVYRKACFRWENGVATGWNYDLSDHFNTYDFEPIHYCFPYECGTEIKLKTPTMNSPVYGYLVGGKDKYGEWGYYLYGDKEVVYLDPLAEEDESPFLVLGPGIDLGCHVIQDEAMVYVALDWLEPVE